MEEEKKVKLIGFWASPFVYRVIWALKLKGVNFEYVEENIFGKSDLLLHLNPIYKKVPVFVHGEKSIPESIIILQYIDQIWPQNRLISDDPYDKSVALFWSKFGDDKMQTIFPFFETVGENQEKATKEAKEVLGKIEEYGLGEKKYFGGNDIGLADIAFGWLAWWYEMLEQVFGVKLLDQHSFPKLYAWTHNFKQVPLIRENLPHRDEMLAYLTRLRDKVVTQRT